MSKVKLINGLSDIYHNYDAFIIDQWGVMHDGEKAYQSAITCINTLFKNKKMLSIVSNSSRKITFFFINSTVSSNQPKFQKIELSLKKIKKTSQWPP